VIPLFQNQDAGALSHDEPVAVDVEGAREFGVAQRGHVAKAGLGDLDHHRFGAASNRDGASSARDESRGVADGVRAGRARGRDRLTRPAEPKRIETAAVAALGIIIGTMNGETRAGPFSVKTRNCSSTVWRPPMPLSRCSRRRGAGPLNHLAPRLVGRHQRVEREGSNRRSSLGPPNVRVSKARCACSPAPCPSRGPSIALDTHTGATNRAEARDGHPVSRNRPLWGYRDAHYSLA